MKDKKGVWNVASGLFFQLLTIGFGLILPRLFILNYGSETNGLISSVGQIYAYLALLESGIGTASLQALYKAIGHGDQNDINSILAATHYYYKRIGTIYLVAIFGLTGIYPIVVQTSIPRFTVAMIVLISGLEGLLSYFFHGKYSILLRAEGRNYVLNNLNMLLYILSNAAKILLIYLGYDIVVIQLSLFTVSILRIFCLLSFVRKKNPWINLSVSPNYEALSNRKSVFIHKLSNLVFSNTDIIFLTLMCGLKEVSRYTIYLSFFNMVKSVLFSFLDGIQYKLAQTYHSDFLRFKRMQDSFEAIYITMTFALYTILYLLITPFLRLYTVGIVDIQYVDRFLPILFTFVFLLQAARGPMQLVTEYAQKFRETQVQSILEMVINLVVTFIAVIHWGIYGVLIGTIIALIYRSIAIIWYVDRNILHKSPWITCKRWGWNAFLFLIISILDRLYPLTAEKYDILILKGILAALIVAFLYALALRVFEKEAYNQFRFMLLKRRKTE